jgi:hypothetical protein
VRTVILAAVAMLTLGAGAAFGAVLGNMFDYSSGSNPTTISSSTKG